MKILVLALMFLMAALPAQAQLLTGTDNSAPAKNPVPETSAPEKKESVPPADRGLPLEITADNSLEWQRNEKTFTAKGNALAKQGDTSVAAQTLTAHYTEKKGGGMEVTGIKASEGVAIKSNSNEVFGSNADYDLVKGYAVMTGNNLRMVSPDQTVTANEKFEYWVADGKLAAVGGAKAVRGNDTLEADKISAVMKNGPDGKRVLDMLEATGHVVIKTPTETASGSKAIYRAATDKAELTGGVKITRGPNTLEGERAEVDLATNTSRLFGSTGGGRVRGVFFPGSENKP